MCVCVCDQEMMDVFSGLTKVMIYSHSMILVQMAAVLAFLIPGLIVTGR